MVTLGFLAGGGDGYPFPQGDGVNRVDLAKENVRTGVATFADDGTEQDALAEYLSANFTTTPYSEADTPISEDSRIQNLDFRADAVFAEEEPASSLLITEIVEGSGLNKAVEIANIGDKVVNLADEGYALKIFFNGNTSAGTTIALTGVLNPGDVFVVADDGASPGILAVADQTSTASFFNGDDAIVLSRGQEVVDSFGTIGVDPGSEWPGGGANDTLRRKAAVTQGDVDPTDAFDAAEEWDAFPQDDVSDLGALGGNGGGGGELTLISAIQGSSDFSGLAGFAKVGRDDVSPLLGTVVTVEAIVTADFQGSTALNGFFLQEEDADQDGDAVSSEGLFVFDGAGFSIDVEVGQKVHVTGAVGEFFGQTQIAASFVEIIASNQSLPTAAVVDLGATGVMLDDDAAVDYVVDLERFEGMLVAFPEALTISEMFNLDRFGEYRVSSEGRPEQFTQSNAPSVAGFDAHLRNVASRSLVLDDGSGVQNPATLEIIDGGDGVLTATDSFRMGDTLTNLTGVVAYGFDEFRLHDAVADYAATNPRPEAPAAVGGNFKVASLNVLNYFTTIDTGLDNSGPNDTLKPRGADSAEEFARQAQKTVAAIVALDADVLGLVELENDDDIAIADLVARVNAALGAEVYDFVATGDVGTDAITTGIIYKTATVAPLGAAAILTAFDGRSFVDPLGAGSQQNRPAVAQTFEHIATGEMVTVAVNHLKSKGSSTGVAADDNQFDGQGASNATRAAAADILADWLAADPTGQGAENQLILGDFNAYAQEDPIKAFEAAGFKDVAAAFVGAGGYSYVFDGQTGTLDYILANGPAFDKATGATEWLINADEADAIDYNLDFGRDPTLFDGATAARNSDHDPVLAGFEFEPRAPELNLVQGGAGLDRLTGTDAADLLVGGAGNNVLAGLGGADVFQFGAELANGRRETTQIRDYEGLTDIIDLGSAEVASFRETGAGVILTVGPDRDTIILRGVSDFDQILFAEDSLIG